MRPLVTHVTVPQQWRWAETEMRGWLLAAVLMAVPVAARAEMLDFSVPDKAATSLAMKAFASELADARAAGAEAAVWARPYDLNGDGKPEVVGQISSAYMCGGMGSCFFVVKDGAVLFNVPGVDVVEVLDGKTRGWRDLRFNEQALWKFNGQTYDIAK